LSQEQVLKRLANLGFDQVDAQVYVYLAKKGVQQASEIRKAAKLTKQQLYPSLKRLQSKGIVNSTIEHPARFSALPFEKVLDIFIKAKVEEIQTLQQSKAEILSNWQNLKIEDDKSEKFTVIEGRSYIYSKIQQMIQETRNQVLTITTIPTLAQANQRDIFDTSYNNLLKSKIQFRFLAELSKENIHIIKALLKETSNSMLDVEGRNPDFGLTLFPQMLVRDEEEVLFFTKPRTETSIIEKDDVCLWTDCITLVKAFVSVFDDLWRSSTDVQEKITEIETGKVTPKEVIIEYHEMAKKKYNKIVKSAREDILIMTSSKGLVEFCKNVALSNELTEKGVAVRIMAPIISKNFRFAEQLSKSCSIKHVPPNYVPTTIVDGKHLLQFKNPAQKNKPPDSSPHFESMLYTNDPEYVQKMKTMLNEIWKNANPPSTDNLQSIFGTGIRSHSAYFPGAIRSPGPSGTFQPLPPAEPTKRGTYITIEVVDEDPLGKLKEQDVLNEIVHAQKASPKKAPSLCKIYSSQAIAVIHPPDFFQLPPMLIRVHHVEKHSTFGAEDVILINLWLETTSGPAFVPVAVLSDSPTAQARWGKHAGATPANSNVLTAKRDEIQIRIHGNTLFAGWTIPITLYPSEYILPPACMLIEGYGDVITEAYSVVQPTGGKFTAKQNGFNAFVTFMHPSSKYSGPGTDGFLVRDFLMEVTPEFVKGFNPKLETKLIEKKKHNEKSPVNH
jgi:sugar-specific transcriptional regulator TrmB